MPTRIFVFTMLLFTLPGCFDPRAGDYRAADLFKDEGVIQLANAVARDERDEIIKLLASGIDPNTLGYDGISLLIWGVGARSSIGLETLIEQGANPDYVAPNGVSAVSLAAGAKRSRMLKALLKSGANPNAIENGQPALHIAVSQNRDVNYKLLVEAGADINATDSRQETAVVIAVGVFGRYDLAVYSLEHGLSHELRTLASYTEFRAVGAKQQPWREKTFQLLKERGIQFPVYKKKNN